uniref:Uncharacterized protein n=1 Tax=Arundo donax TaxID=35708 RepID=A0A0A9QN23_ARUDO
MSGGEEAPDKHGPLTLTPPLRSSMRTARG